MSRKTCLYSIIRIGIFSICLIITYSIILRIFIKTKEDDPLISLHTDFMGNFFNGWTILHFILFVYIGYTYPECGKEAIILGILWEIIEWSIGDLFPKIFPELAHQIDPFWTDWYYGKVEDVIMNSAGFYLGRWIYKLSQ